MPGAWEIEAIKPLMEEVQLQNLASGFATLVSGAVSGQTIHVIKLDAYSQNNLSGPQIFINEVDGTAAATSTLRFTHQWVGALSGEARTREKTWGGDDIDRPILLLDGASRLDVRTDMSGQVGVRAMVIRRF